MKTMIKTLAAVICLTCLGSCEKEATPVGNRTNAAAADGLAGTHYIGENFGGGIIFYLDQTGAHGLVVSKDEVLAKWWNGTFIQTYATGTAIGTGAPNTQKIVRAQGRGGKYAALVCAVYESGGYTDWFLPSVDELGEVYKQRAAIGQFAAAPYWSSTENSTGSAWYQNFSLGNQFTGSKDGAGYVRAVRKF